MWRFPAWLALFAVLGLALLPFTERGSRLLLEYAAPLVPLEIEYGAGTLAGELAIEKLAWHSEDLSIELRGLVLALEPGCLWRSALCFQQLFARELLITVPPTPEAEPDATASDEEDTPLVFPVPISAAQLQLDSLRVAWEGGEWRQGKLQGAVQIMDSTISVDRAQLLDATLTLRDSEDSDETVELPELYLPLDLRVAALELVQGHWDVYGQGGQLHSLRLEGRWQGRELSLATVQLQSPELGEWLASAGIEFAGQWPLTADLEGELPPLPALPAALGRSVSGRVSGTLAALSVRLATEARVTLAANLEVDTLDPELAFQLVADANWSGALALDELGATAGDPGELALESPLHLAASGTLQEQVFQLQGTVTGARYPALDIQLAGSHAGGRLQLEDLRAQDQSGANTLWGSAELRYGEDDIRFSGTLESSGLDLPPLGALRSGRVEGQLALRGSLGEERWTLDRVDAEVKGNVNGFPALITGYAGIDSQLRLLPSQLEARVNGASLELRSPSDPSLPVALDLRVPDLGLWLEGGRGSLSARASAPAGWGELSFEGAAQSLGWQTLQVARAEFDGRYQAGGQGNFSVDLQLGDIALGALEFSTLRLSASGDTATQQVSLRTRGDIETALEVSGRGAIGGDWRGQLAPATLQTAEGNWHLDAPVALSYLEQPSQVRVAAHCWLFNRARLCPGEALLGARGSASALLEGNLSEFAGFLPANLDVQGALSARLDATWSPDQPYVVDARAQVLDVRFIRHYGGGESGEVAWQRIDLSARNDRQGLELGAEVIRENRRILALDLRLPEDRSQPLAGELDVSGLQLSMLAPFAPTVSALEGEVNGTLQLAGTLERPLARGSLKLGGGHFTLLGNPTELQQFELALEAQGERATLRGKGLLGGGALSLDGTILTSPRWQLDLAVTGDHQEILLPPYTQMLVSETLALKLSPGLLQVSGDIVVHEGSLEQEQLPAGGVTLSDDVVEVDLVGNVVSETTPFDINMHVGLLIENRFKLVGDMVNATLGGDLTLRQEPRQPLQVFGNLNVLDGELSAYQQRLSIRRGTISFSGNPENPELDVRAQREISTDKVIVGLSLQGTLKQPQLEVFSDPVMSHAETMSYLVRGRGLDSGAGADGMAMALSLGTGLVNRTALVEELNRIPGISNFAFGTEGSTEEDTAATVGGYIGERLYLSYGMGIYEPINILTARLYLQTRLWLEVVSRLENSVDLYYSFDIE